MVTTEYTVVNEKLKGSHDIVMISDFHNVKKAMDISLKIARDLYPEAVFVVGDLVDRHRKKYDLALAYLTECVKIAPTFFSYGNHECSFEKISRGAFEYTGAVVLRNEYTRFSFENGDEILVGGHDPNASVYWMKDFENEHGFKLLMCHHPENYLDRMMSMDIDLILSGHAHGGQIRIFGQGVLAPGQGLLPKHTKGIFYNKFIVGTGISNTAGIIPRLGNPAEVVLIHLQPA